MVALATISHKVIFKLGNSCAFFTVDITVAQVTKLRVNDEESQGRFKLLKVGSLVKAEQTGSRITGYVL